MLVLLILLATMASVALASPRYSVDSRPGFCDRNRRIGRALNGRVSSPTPNRFH